MKKLSIFSVILIAALTMFSCTSKKPKAEPMFTAEDTTKVLAMTEAVMQALSEKNFDAAFAEMFELDKDQLEKLSPHSRKELAEYYSTFPVLRYKLEKMTFTNIYDVKLTYSFEFFDKPEGDNLPNTMKVTFAPQRLNKIWYLALEK